MFWQAFTTIIGGGSTGVFALPVSTPPLFVSALLLSLSRLFLSSAFRHGAAAAAQGAKRRTPASTTAARRIPAAARAFDAAAPAACAPASYRLPPPITTTLRSLLRAVTRHVTPGPHDGVGSGSQLPPVRDPVRSAGACLHLPGRKRVAAPPAAALRPSAGARPAGVGACDPPVTLTLPCRAHTLGPSSPPYAVADHGLPGSAPLAPVGFPVTHISVFITPLPQPAASLHEAAGTPLADPSALACGAMAQDEPWFFERCPPPPLLPVVEAIGVVGSALSHASDTAPVRVLPEGRKYVDVLRRALEPASCLVGTAAAPVDLGAVLLPADDFAHLVVVDRSHARLAAWQQRWRATGINCCVIRQVLHRQAVADRAIWILDALLPQSDADRAADDFNNALRCEADSRGRRPPAALACANRPRGARPAWILRPELQKGGVPVNPDLAGNWPIRIVDRIAFAATGAGPFSLTTRGDSLWLSGYGTAGADALRALATEMRMQLLWLEGTGGAPEPRSIVTLGPLVPIRVPAADGERLARAALQQLARRPASENPSGDGAALSATGPARAPTGAGGAADTSAAAHPDGPFQASPALVFERHEVLEGESGSFLRWSVRGLGAAAHLLKFSVDGAQLRLTVDPQADTRAQPAESGRGERLARQTMVRQPAAPSQPCAARPGAALDVARKAPGTATGAACPTERDTRQATADGFQVARGRRRGRDATLELAAGSAAIADAAATDRRGGVRSRRRRGPGQEPCHAPPPAPRVDATRARSSGAAGPPSQPPPRAGVFAGRSLPEPVAAGRDGEPPPAKRLCSDEDTAAEEGAAPPAFSAPEIQGDAIVDSPLQRELHPAPPNDIRSDGGRDAGAAAAPPRAEPPPGGRGSARPVADGATAEMPPDGDAAVLGGVRGLQSRGAAAEGTDSEQPPTDRGARCQDLAATEWR